MASLELDVGVQLTLAYFTSDWVQPVDAIVLPRLREIVNNVNAHHKHQDLIHLLEVRRTAEDVENSQNVKVQQLEPSAFQMLCKHLSVTDLPACVLLDAQGQLLGLEAVKALESKYYQPLESEQNKVASPISPNFYSPWKVLVELVQDIGASAAAWQALWPLRKVPVTRENAEFPELVQVDNPVLVKMRKEAFKLFEEGQFLPALSKFADVLLRCPTCTKSSFNLAVILHTIGETYFAVTNMLRVVALDDSDSVAHTILRSMYFQEEPELVVAGYRSIITTHRDSHVRAVHSLATLEGASTTLTAAPAYVAKVFDELADTFEEKLVAHLEYRVPWQLVEALEQLSPPGFTSKNSVAEPEWIVADLGCGTGLCGRLLRPHVKHLIGVDISPLMIEKTRDESNYDELHTIDIVPFLESSRDASLNLVISADVWIYVGALDRVFELCARKLDVSMGWMAFSIELFPNKDGKDDANDMLAGFRLATSGRFQHSPKYIEALAYQWGFTIVVQRDIVVRKESGEPLPGRIYIMNRKKKS